MREVAIIGAGELGGELAHALARRDTVAAIRLVDEAGQVARGKALDIMQAAPIEGFSTIVSGGTDAAAAAGSPIVVVADRAGAGEWTVDDSLSLLTRFVRAGSAAVVICAGAGHRDLVERGVREAGYPRARLIGSAPEALAAALRAMVALEVNGSVRDVGLTVLGVPPSHVVVPWEDAAIAGLSASRLLDQAARRRLDARLGRLWPPGPTTLARAALAVVDAIAGRSRRALSCFLAPDDSMGRRHRAAAVLVRLGLDGIVEEERPALNDHDRVALENAVMM
jgi:malate dehydrogenase